jgi:hypothetical protein
LKIVLENLPSILGAILAGAATIVSTFALWKGTENGKKADAANVKTDLIAKKAETIRLLTDGHFTRVSEELKAANESIARLQSQDDSRVVGILQKHQVVLSRMDGDITQLSVEVRSVRDRQHDMANFMNQIGLGFELKPIPTKDFPER